MAVVNSNEYDHIDIVVGSNTNRHFLKDTTAREDIADLKGAVSFLNELYYKFSVDITSRATIKIEINASAGAVYKLTSGCDAAVGLWTMDASQQTVDALPNLNVGATITVTIPHDAVYLGFYSTGSGTVTVEDMGAVFPSFVDEVNDDIKAVEQNVVYKVNPTINYTDGQYLTPGGAIVTGQSSGLKTTGFIALQDIDVLVNIPATNFITNAYTLMIAYYSAQDYNSFISGVSANGQPILSLIPKGAKYVVFGSNTNVSGTYTALNASIEIQGALKRDGDVPEQKAFLSCPDSYDLIVGDTFELFYKGIINSFDSDAYFVSASCSIGANYKKRFIVTPATSGTYSLALSLYDTNGNLLDSKTISLIVHATPSSPGTNKNVLCVGDSLTADGVWTAEFGRRILQSGGTPAGFNLSNITFIGTKEHSGINYEGYPGYNFNSYNTNNPPGNPFWDSTAGKVDFAKYATEQGASSIDFVYVLLGWNSWSSSLSTTKQTAQTFIDNIHTSFQNAKIVLMGLQIPSRDGLAMNYGAYSGNISDYLKMMEYVHDLDAIYDDLADENTNVYHMNLSGQFDTEHNMPQSTRPVNTRNSETEIYQTNGIHPAESGELQIADAVTRHFVGLLS